VGVLFGENEEQMQEMEMQGKKSSTKDRRAELCLGATDNQPGEAAA
jgi:hypothetical protein